RSIRDFMVITGVSPRVRWTSPYSGLLRSDLTGVARRNQTVAFSVRISLGENPCKSCQSSFRCPIESRHCAALLPATTNLIDVHLSCTDDTLLCHHDRDAFSGCAVHRICKPSLRGEVPCANSLNNDATVTESQNLLQDFGAQSGEILQ